MADQSTLLDLDKIVSDLQQFSANLSEMVVSLDYVNIIHTCGCISYCISDLLEAAAVFVMDRDQNSIHNE